MVIRHAFKVLCSRFSVVYKLLIYILVVTLIFSGVTYASVFSVVKPIIDGIQDMQFFPHLAEAFRSVFSGNVELASGAFLQVKLDFQAIGEVFATNQSNVVLAAVLFTLFVFIANFFINICRLPVADILNNFMNSNSEFGLISNIVANIKKAVAYSAVNTMIILPYYLIVAVACWYMMAWLIGVSFLLTMSLVLLFVIFMLSVKNSILAMWLPTYINEDKGVFASLVSSVKAGRKLFVENLGLYFITCLLIYAVSVMFGLITFGIGFVLAMSFNKVLFIAIEQVIYYRENELKYYIDPQEVVDSKKVVKSIIY